MKPCATFRGSTPGSSRVAVALGSRRCLPPAQRRRSALCRSSKEPKTPSSDAPPPSGSSSANKYEYSDPVNRFFGNFLPPARDVAAELSFIDWDAAKARGLSVEAMAASVEEKLSASEWFVTGEVDPTLFSDDFEFKDDTVATAGIRSYALGVRKLFDQETSRAELVAVEANAENSSVKVVWRLEGRVNLPGRPTIPPYVVTTTLGTNADGLICSQLDEFGVPGWQLLSGALLGAWAGPEPAPPVEQLRKDYQQQ